MSDALDALRSDFGSLADCCLHQPAWRPDDVAEVLASAWHGDESGGWHVGSMSDKTCNESCSYTVVKLSDGRYGLLDESEDYTGHGCQCGSSATAYGSLHELLFMGVPDGEAREILAAAAAP